MSHHLHLPPQADWAVRSFIRRHKRVLRWCCLAGVLVVLLLVVTLASGLFHGAGRLRDWAAEKAPALQIPLEWEKPLGDAALAQVRTQFRLLTDPQIIEPLQRLAAPLFAGQTNSADHFTLLVVDASEVNAFALPGGYIVMHRGLLEQAQSAEEIQGVLAHEMAHVLKRHGVLQLAKSIGLNLVIQSLQGGESRLLDALLRDSGQLLGLKFSRDHERAADELGWELLERAQVNPRGLTDFFTRLKAQAETKGPAGLTPGATLLSTHPAPQERLDRLQSKAAALGQREFNSFTSEFQALRQGLSFDPGAAGKLRGDAPERQGFRFCGSTQFKHRQL